MISSVLHCAYGVSVFTNWSNLVKCAVKTVVHGCGVIISIASTSSTISFHEFKAKKFTERGKFLDKKSKRRKTADETPVIITVGIASSKKGILKIIPGKSSPLKVRSLHQQKLYVKVFFMMNFVHLQ